LGNLAKTPKNIIEKRDLSPHQNIDRRLKILEFWRY
jgi:hypothetical protein